MSENMNTPKQSRKYVHLLQSIVRSNHPYSFETMEEDIKLLEKIYPFIKVKVIGASELGKPLYELKVGNGEGKIHINGSFHANEWLTTSIIMKFVNEYALALSNEQKFSGVNPMLFFRHMTLSIVPMVNPDGVDLVLQGPPVSHKQSVLEMNMQNHDFTWWKANINGVDLNNQFPAKWEIEKKRKFPKAPAPRDYPGQKPLSESESQALAKLALTENFDMVLALHSQGREIYWGYEGYEPGIAKDIVEEMERVSQYKGLQYIDSHAGFRDWFIQEFRKPGYTIEIGKGINPLPLSSFRENYRDIEAIITACLKCFVEVAG